MKKQVLTCREDLCEGEIIERLNRFTLAVGLDSTYEKVYLANPGALSTVIVPGRKVLCEPASGKNRKTDYNAFAIKIGDIYVTVNSVFANTIFFKVLERGLLENFRKYSLISREPALPDHGRTDFLLKNRESGNQAYVEVKSCTHVEDGVAKFPDRPTKRGRQHLRALKKLSEEGLESHLVFVVQRPDAEEFQPFKEVDPEFTNLLNDAKGAGVNVRAISTEFDPPIVYLRDGNLPINMV